MDIIYKAPIMRRVVLDVMKGQGMNRNRLLVPVLVITGLFVVGCAAEKDFSRPQTPDIENWEVGYSPKESGTAGELPDLETGAELPTLLRYAALRNPGLEAAFNRWKASLERIPQVWGLPDPRFTYRYFIEEVETRVGSQRQSFGIAQTFPWFGKLTLRGDAAAEAAKAEYQRYQAAKLKLFYQVKHTYCEYYYLARAVAITEENIRLLKHIETMARTRYKVAAGAHSDVIRAQVELGKLDDRGRSLREMFAPVVAALNASLNRPGDAPLGIPTELRQEKMSVTDKEVLAMLRRTNPDLKAMDFEISREKLRIDLAKKEYFPDVTLGVNYIDTANSTGGRHPSGDGGDPIMATVSVNLPIWWNKLSAGVREARYRHFAALRRKVQRTNSLSSQVKMLLYRFRDAGRKINLYRDTLLPKVRQSLKVTEASFRAGRGSFIDLVDAQRILLEFELTYERALADCAQRLGELEMLVGRDLPRAATTDSSPKE